MTAPAISLHDRIVDLEAAISEMPQLHLETRHYFAAGLYARELRIPAGTVLTGAMHLHEHLNIISAGTIEVATDEGAQTITAPATIVSPPGTKRAGYAVTDVVWTTISANPLDERDLPTLERMLVADADRLASAAERKKLES